MLKIVDGFEHYGYINIDAIERIEYNPGGYRSFILVKHNYPDCKDHSRIIGWPWSRRRVRGSSRWIRPQITLIMASGTYLYHRGTRKDKSQKIYENLLKLTRN